MQQPTCYISRMQAESVQDRNKALLTRWFNEVWNQGRTDVIDELRAPDAIATGLAEGQAKSQGKRPFEAFHSNLRAALPDLHVNIEDLIAEGDKVAVRVTLHGTHRGSAFGLAPTGREITLGAIVIVHIKDGKIAQAWNNIDQLALARQIGALSAGAPPGHFLTMRA
jgi:steroid delta-isomerase-like uncharacterized protein